MSSRVFPLVCRAPVPVFFVRLACARLFSNKVSLYSYQTGLAAHCKLSGTQNSPTGKALNSCKLNTGEGGGEGEEGGSLGEL